MNWKRKAKIVEHQTSLGERESQVLVLNRDGFDIAEILEQIGEVEKNPPTIGTLRSIRSKLKKRDIQIRIGRRVMNDGVENILLPHRTDYEFSESVTTVAYIGSIGSGKTVGAKKHILDLVEDADVEEVTVVDVLDEWKKFRDIENVSVKDVSQQPSGDRILEEVKSTIDEMQESKNYVIFIEQAHYLLVDDEKIEELYRSIEDTNSNISLRLLSQTYDEFISPEFEINVYNIFRMSTNPLPDIGVENFGLVTPRNLSTGSQKPISEVIQYNVEKDEASLWCIYLTDRERNIILE